MRILEAGGSPWARSCRGSRALARQVYLLASDELLYKGAVGAFGAVSLGISNQVVARKIKIRTQGILD